MFKIENIGKNYFYVKAIGTFPPSVAGRFIQEFEEKATILENFSVIVDILDAIFLDLKSFDPVLEFLKRNNEKLLKSAFVISDNLLLNKEFQLLLEKADSPKRKIVNNLDDAKEWVGIKDIIIK